MEIRQAGIGEASTVLGIMLEAFEEYRHAEPPTSALDETVVTLIKEMTSGDRAALCFIDGVPVASVRYSFVNGIYFHRLAVKPEYQHQGIGTALVGWLEREAIEGSENSIWCMVRASLPKNIAFYRSLGFVIEKEVETPNPNGDLVRTVWIRKRLAPRA